MEAQRLSALEVARARYTAECTARDVEAAEHNNMLDELMVQPTLMVYTMAYTDG